MHLRTPTWRVLFGWMLLLALAIMPLVGCTFYGERAARSYDDATGGESLERVFWRNVASQNWKQVESALASNYTALWPSGILDRGAALDRYQHWNVKDYSLGDVKTELNGNTIVVTYTITVNGNGSAAQLPNGPHHMMSVWQQQKSGWILIAQSVLAQNGAGQN